LWRPRNAYAGMLRPSEFQSVFCQDREQWPGGRFLLIPRPGETVSRIVAAPTVGAGEFDPDQVPENVQRRRRASFSGSYDEGVVGLEGHFF
jgi:hypothetical protein